MADEKRTRQAGPSLQCPRCGSNNTKFCYYNNYNTAQPRHFCRDCHRYWTQGGALRNIPAPGESTNRKRSRRYSTASSSQTSSKVPRIQAADSSPVNSTVVAGAALAAIAITPAPPPSPAPILFGEGIGMVGAGFPLRPTLPLFDQGFIRGLRGFPPFNSLLFPTPPPPLPLPLLHGLNMNQVLTVNAGDGSGASGAADDHVHMHACEGGNAQDGNGGDLFANQFFTRFVDADVGGAARADFNAGEDEATNQIGAGAATDGRVAGATTDDPGPAPPASFI